MPIMIIIEDVPSQKVWSLVKQADRTGVKDYRYYPEGLTQQCWEGVQHPNSHRHTSHVSAFSSSSPSTSPSSGTSQVWRPRLSFRGKSPAATHVIITSSTSTNPQNSRQQSLVHDNSQLRLLNFCTQDTANCSTTHRCRTVGTLARLH